MPDSVPSGATFCSHQRLMSPETSTTPTTMKSTPASPNAARARANPLTGPDTLHLADFFPKLQMGRHRVQDPGLERTRSIPRTMRDRRWTGCSTGRAARYYSKSPEPRWVKRSGPGTRSTSRSLERRRSVDALSRRQGPHVQPLGFAPVAGREFGFSQRCRFGSPQLGA